MRMSGKRSYDEFEQNTAIKNFSRYHNAVSMCMQFSAHYGKGVANFVEFVAKVAPLPGFALKRVSAAVK